MFGFKQEHLGSILQRTVCHKRAAKKPFKEKKRNVELLAKPHIPLAQMLLLSDQPKFQMGGISTGPVLRRSGSSLKRQLLLRKRCDLWMQMEAQGNISSNLPFFIEECFVLFF